MRARAREWERFWFWFRGTPGPSPCALCGAQGLRSWAVALWCHSWSRTKSQDLSGLSLAPSGAIFGLPLRLPAAVSACSSSCGIQGLVSSIYVCTVRILIICGILSFALGVLNFISAKFCGNT